MKNYPKIHLTLLFLFLLMLTESCNVEKNSNQALINPPFESISKEYQEFEVNASEGKTISMPNGSQIIIPANAFVTKDNKQIKGSVKILYREFHDAADIMISGIPMEYDSAGTQSYFQTAGMFEILGSQKNAPVYIAKDQSIEVKLASNVGEDIYNFYSLDSTSGNWTYQGKTSPEPNEEKQKKIEAALGTPVARPIEPAKFDPDKFVFDVEINTKRYPELTDFHDIIWQYVGSSDSIDPEKNDWIFSEKWTGMDLEIKDSEQSVFWLTLSHKTKSFKTLVKAVFSDKKIEYAKKNFQKRKDAYDAYLTRMREEARRYQNQLNFIRSFQVRNMGVHNWDRIFPGMEVLAADFEFDQEVNTNLLSVYLITGDTRVAMPYPKSNWGNFQYPPGQNSVLVAVMPGDKIAISRELMDMKFSMGKKPEKHTFKLTTIDKQIKNPADLREIFSKL